MPEPTKAPQQEDNPYLKMMQEDAPQAEQTAVQPQPQAQPSQKDSTALATIKNVGSHMKNMVMGPIHAFGDAPDASEAGIGAGMDPLSRQASLGLYRMFAKPTVQAAGTAIEQGKKGNFFSKDEYDANGNYHPSAFSSAVDAIPLAGPWARNIETEAHQKGLAPALAGLATDVMTPIAAGRAIKAAPMAATDALEYMRPRSSPNIISPIEMHAERLGQSILPPGGLTPQLLESIRHEGPAIREFAQRTGNPLKTQAEGLKAAQGVGSEGVAHFNENFLKPNADIQVQLPNNVSPSLGHVSTLEKINHRIAEINDLERATAGKSEGATMTAQERLGLQAEAKGLRQKLYQTLSQRTGVAPDDIRNLREGYGGQYTVADALESARMGRLNRIGKSEQGQNPLNMPHGVGDLVTKGITALRGGEEAIANRQFASRIRNFEPQRPIRPIPTDQNQPPAFSEDEMRGFIRPRK